MNQKRNGSIELLRFLFTIIICYFHLFLNNSQSKTFPFRYGYFAVEFFFMVSGFFIANNVMKINNNGPVWENSLQTTKKKFSKLMLPFYIGYVYTFVARHICENQFLVKPFAFDFLKDISVVFLVSKAGFSIYGGYGHTWYISSMFIAFLLIIPCLFKFRKNYVYCIAPFASIVLYGYLNHEFGLSIGDVTAWQTYFFKCQIRAFADINCGIVIWGVVQRVKQINWTSLGLFIISLLEVLCYGVLILYTTNDGNIFSKRYDYSMIFVLFVALTISLTNRTYLNRVLEKIKIVYWLGDFSLYIYLSHYILSIRVIPKLLELNPNMNMVVTYSILVIISSLGIKYTCILFNSKIIPAVKKQLIRDDKNPDLEVGLVEKI